MDENIFDTQLFGIGINSFNRFETFLKIKDQLKGPEYWYNLRVAYTNSDNLFRYSEEIKECFLSNEPGVNSLMTQKDLIFFENLPEEIIVYRGMSEQELMSGRFGISWTLKKEVADFFANTYLRNFDTKSLIKVVHKMNINKNDVIAFINESNEFEILFINK